MKTHIKTRVPPVPPTLPQFEEIYKFNQYCYGTAMFIYFLLMVFQLCWVGPIMSLITAPYQLLIVLSMTQKWPEKFYFWWWNKRYGESYKYWSKNEKENKN
jgi:hypothetical protein